MTILYFLLLDSCLLSQEFHSMMIQDIDTDIDNRYRQGFPGGSDGEKSSFNAGDPGSIPGSGSSPGEGIGYPLQYSWASLVAQLVKNSPQCRKPGFDPWVGKIPWRKERLPTPVFWPGEFHGQRSVVGYSPWVTESDTTERLHFHFMAPNPKKQNSLEVRQKLIFYLQPRWELF